MTFLQQIDELKQTWKVLMPSIAAPPDTTFARWVNDFGYESCEIAIRRVPWRFRAELNNNQHVEPDHAHKFVTQTMVGLRKVSMIAGKPGPGKAVLAKTMANAIAPITGGEQ